MGLAALWFVLKMLGWILVVVVAVILLAVCLPVRARVFGEAGFSGSIGDLVDGTANLELGWQQKASEDHGKGCDDGRGAGDLCGNARGASSGQADGTPVGRAEEPVSEGVEDSYEDSSPDLVVVNARGQAQASILGGLVSFDATTGGAVALRVIGIRVYERPVQGGESDGSVADCAAGGGSSGGGSAGGGSSGDGSAGDGSAGGGSSGDGSAGGGSAGGGSSGGGSTGGSSGGGSAGDGSAGGGSAGGGSAGGGSSGDGSKDSPRRRFGADVKNSLRRGFRLKRLDSDTRNADATDSGVDSSSGSAIKGGKSGGRRRVVTSIKGIKRYLAPGVRRKTRDFAKKTWRMLNVSLDVDVEYGLGDPGYTGMAYAAYLSAGNAFGLKGLHVKPNFTQEMLEVEGDLQTRFIPVALVWRFAAYALSPDIRPLWSRKRQ